MQSFQESIDKSNTKLQCYGSGPALRIRIRIQEGHNYLLKWRKFKFLRARCSLWRDEDFSGSMDVDHGGLGISNFWPKNIYIFFSWKFFPIFGHQNSGTGAGRVFSLKCWIRIRNQHCKTGVRFVKNRINPKKKGRFRYNSIPPWSLAAEGCPSGSGSQRKDSCAPAKERKYLYLKNRLNIELDLQSLFGLLCTAVLNG